MGEIKFSYTEIAKQALHKFVQDEYGMTLKELAELVNAKQEGRCVVLPCAIEAGQHIFVIEPAERTGTASDSVWCNTVISFTHKGIFYKNGLYFPVYFEPFDKFGKTWFLDRESAEAKLKEIEENGLP